MIAKKMAASRGVFIWSKLGQNLSEMDVRTFARIKKVIWDQLLPAKVIFSSKSLKNSSKKMLPFNFQLSGF